MADQANILTMKTRLSRGTVGGPDGFPRLNRLPELKSVEAIERDTIFGESFAHDIADIENPQASLLYRWIVRGYEIRSWRCQTLINSPIRVRDTLPQSRILNAGIDP